MAYEPNGFIRSSKTMRYRLYPNGDIVDTQKQYKRVGLVTNRVVLTRLLAMRAGMRKDKELKLFITNS